MATAWALVPLFLDGALVLAFHWALPHLAARFTQKSVGNGLIVGGAYVLVCVAAYLVKRLGPAEPPGGTSTSGVLAGVGGLFFGFFVLFMIADTSGLLDLVHESEGGTPGFAVVLLALLGIALALLFSGILFLVPSAEVSAEPEQFEWTHAVALLLVNAMVLCLLAFWRSYFETGAEPYEGLGMGGKILIFVFVWIFYLLFLSAPRLLLLGLNLRTVALLSFLLSSGYFVWQSLARSAWR